MSKSFYPPEITALEDRVRRMRQSPRTSPQALRKMQRRLETVQGLFWKLQIKQWIKRL